MRQNQKYFPLFDRSGKPVARFEPAVKPDAPEVQTAIESALGK